MIYKNGVPHKWIDQPYTVRRKPGNTVEFLEQIPSIPSIQTQDRITISLAQTGFFTVTGMIDSTVCHCATGVVDTLPLFYASDSLDFAPIFKGDTLTIVGRDLAHVSFDSLLQKYVIQVDSITGGSGTVTSFSSGNLSPLFTTSVATATTTPALSFTLSTQSANTVFSGPTSGGAAAPTFRALVLADILGLNTANNGLSDNEAGGGVFRLGNRYMNGSDGPFGTDRKVNVNAFMGFFGDNSDSTLLTIDGTNDRIGIGMLPANRLDVSGASGTYIRVGTAGAVANAGLILNNSADVADTWAVYRQGDGDFAIGADADNEWPNGTLTDPFIIKPSPPSNSFYMDATGKVQLGGTSPQRTLHVTGEARITDLVTDNPTVLVGADADGDLSAVTLGTGLSYTGTTLNATGGSFYQTMRDNGTGETQRAALNFISSASVSALLTDDVANGETEVTFAIPNNGVTNALLRTSAGLSVIGRSANTTGNVADITAANDAEVLRRSGTTLGFGTVATAGITDDAVTYAKIQNVVSDDVFLGRISGAGGNVEELTAANAYTILGLTGVANRFALWTGTNTLASDAAFTFDGTNDRATFTGTVSGVGANNAFLNLNSGAITNSTTFLRASGNITNNLILEAVNANTSSTASTLLTLSTGGDAAGDAVVQFNIAGIITHAIGVDNTNNRFCITPNASTPGASSNGITVYEDGSSIGAVGINNNFPVHPLTVEGRARADLFLGEGNEYSSGNVSFGTGAGTGPSLTQIVGTGNAVMVRFSTGTTPTANGNIFTITYPTAFLTASMVNFSAGCNNASAVAGDNTATDFLKFKISTSDATTFIFKAVGTLAASTAYALTFNVFGY